jgi:hypothetical protein
MRIRVENDITDGKFYQYHIIVVHMRQIYQIRL